MVINSSSNFIYLHLCSKEMAQVPTSCDSLSILTNFREKVQELRLLEKEYYIAKTQNDEDK